MKLMDTIEGEQFFDEYIMAAPGSDYGKAMWSDIGNVKNAILLNDAIKDNTPKLIRLLHHIHFSFWLNKKIDLPFQGAWKPFYSIESVSLHPNKKYCIIFTDISACRTDIRYLEQLSHKKNVTLAMIMVNTVDKKERILKKRMQYFSMLFSFDKNDSEKYGAYYHPMNYSVDTSLCKSKVRYDVFFVGMAKARLPMLKAIYKKLRKSGVKALFYISGVDKTQMSRCGIRYNQWLSYSDVLQYTMQSNCLIEVVDAEQSGITLRTMEAICYNKRLITNNRTIIDSPYFNSAYIKVFEKLSDIDVEFLKDRSPVDYHYQGDFSPIHLLEHINSVYHEQSK